MILFYIFMLMVLGLMTWFVIANLAMPKYNGLLWLHPDHIKSLGLTEGIITINRKPEGQKPFYLQYNWWRWKRHPLYFWAEGDSITETKTEGNKKYTVRRK